MQRLNFRFQKGAALAAEVLSERLNAMVSAINERTPYPGTGLGFQSAGGGFCYTTPARGRASGASLGFTVRHVSDGDFSVSPSQVFGVEVNSGTVPNVDGDLLTADPAPTLAVTGGQTVYLKISLEPVAAGAGPNYFIDPDDYNAVSATLAEDVEIVAADDNSGAQEGAVNATTGALTNAIALIPLASVASSLVDGETVYTVTQLMNGPAAVHYCGGKITVRPPIIVGQL